VASVALADIDSGASSFGGSSQITVTNLHLSAPTSTKAGDVLIANIAINGGSSADVLTTPSSDWHEFARTDNDTSVRLISYWKVADASDINASYDWDINKQTQAEGGITAYSGVDTANPIDAVATTTGSGTTAAAPSVTTNANNEVIITTFATDFGKNANTTYFSIPTGFATKYNAPNTPYGPSIATFDVMQASAGASEIASSAINSNKSHNWVAQQIALKKPKTPPSVNGTVTTQRVDCTATSSVALSHTVAPGSNQMLVITAGAGNQGEDISATYDGVPMIKGSAHGFGTEE
jgi:hypothetical protein